MSRRSELIVRRAAVVALVAAFAVSVVTCVDPKGKFSDFGDRTGTLDASNVDGAELTEIPDISGEFLLSLDPKPVAEGTYIRFIATVELTLAADKKTATMNLTMQPIKVVDGQEIGDPLEFTDVPINSAGRYELTIKTAGNAIPGDANPVTGSDIGLDGVEIGQLLEGNTDVFCGTVSGTVIPTGTVIDGSTFGAVRIAPGTRGNDNLPEPVGECPSEVPPDAGVGDAGVDAS